MSQPLPSQVAPLLQLATRLLQAGRTADALAPLRQAAQLLPGNAPLLHDLGLACLEAGRVTEAIEVLQDCVAADAGFADGWLRLGIALEADGRSREAVTAYRQAAVLPSTAVEAEYRAGHLLEGLGAPGQAAEAFRRSAAAGQGTCPGRVAMARALLNEGRHEEAQKVLRRVLFEEPENAVALDLLGQSLAAAGRFDEARRYLLHAIDNCGGLAGNYYEVARCGRITPEDTDLIERMRAAVSSPALNALQRARVHLGLGKAAADLGDPTEAMRHFDAAQALRDTLLSFDPVRFEARVDGLIARLGAGRFVRSLQPVPTMTPAPILIIGLPRSGTTLVEQILSAHPEVQAGGEMSFWSERGAEWERVRPAEEDGFLSGCGRDYLNGLRAVHPGMACVTDKMPLNVLWAGLIHLALPHATLIHCRRNALDTALSIHQTHFSPSLELPTGGPALVQYVRAYQRLCAHWREVLPASRFVEIDYESLAEDPEPVIRRVVEACRLPWNDACLAPEKNTHEITTPSKWQARQPINRNAVGRWRLYQDCLGPLAALIDDGLSAGR
jgi:tetratricopeptide (TPR) repeat protein